eukprot:GILJ01005768.1.p1 GENE.GILJ01005768.1~~GILJ01005768.1.p1  ORF type:complete len:115 (+),score=18.11 GILJ01005768.1:40-384(+)
MATPLRPMQVVYSILQQHGALHRKDIFSIARKLPEPNNLVLKSQTYLKKDIIPQMHAQQKISKTSMILPSGKRKFLWRANKLKYKDGAHPFATGNILFKPEGTEMESTENQNKS